MAPFPCKKEFEKKKEVRGWNGGDGREKMRFQKKKKKNPRGEDKQASPLYSLYLWKETLIPFKDLFHFF
jgi:hypothetical protein